MHPFTINGSRGWKKKFLSVAQRDGGRVLDYGARIPRPHVLNDNDRVALDL